jgi:hypothetical protein
MKDLASMGWIPNEQPAREFSGLDFRAVQNKIRRERGIMAHNNFKQNFTETKEKLVAPAEGDTSDGAAGERTEEEI